jgi:hypothetical protein
MVSFGVVRVDRDLKTTFKGECKPISDRFIVEALASCNLTREQTLLFPEASETMLKCVQFIAEHNEGDRPIMITDNPAFDWQFMNYYLHAFTGGNPLGHSARRIGDLYSGLRQKFNASGRDWHKLRKTKHTHDPVDDAKGNAEALIAMCDKWNLVIPGVAPLVK